MTFCHKNKNIIIVAQTRNYGIFVAKIYDYTLIDSFGGFPGIIDSITSYATLFELKSQPSSLRHMCGTAYLNALKYQKAPKCRYWK